MPEIGEGKSGHLTRRGFVQVIGAAAAAYEMNGEPLLAGHGFPARVLLPDLYGMKQPRWLKRIVLQETSATTSFWEVRGASGYHALSFKVG